MSLADIKRAVRVGNVYEVTNHYIKREDHPSFGTTRRMVTGVNGSSVTLEGHDGAWSTVKWPKAAQAQMDTDGTIRLYGGGVSQASSDLFLTLTLVCES